MAPASTPSSLRSPGVGMFPDRFEILSPEIQELAVHPVPGKELLTGNGTALGNLVLVVRKDEVYAAGVNVEHIGAEMLADQLERHGGAFEMPSGPAPPEWGIPGGLHFLVFRPRRLPDGEVPHIPLGVFVAGDPVTRPGPARPGA